MTHLIHHQDHLMVWGYKVFIMRENRLKNYKMDMCNGPILKKMLIFALPLICSSMLQLLFNAADIIVVGRYAVDGDNSLAAVGSNASLIGLLTNLFIGLSVGANVLAARDYGAKQNDELGKTVHTAMLLSIYSGIFLTIIGFFSARQILMWMKTPDEIIGLAALYLKIYFLGMPAMMVYNFGSALLRAIGDTRRPLYYLIIAGVINVGLNLLFVIKFHMDVVGVGVATVISQFVSAILVVNCLMHEQGGIKLILKKLHIYRDKFLQILQIGLPAGFQGIIFAISNVVIQSSVNIFGDIVVTGNAAAANIEGFVYVGMNAFHQAALAFTGQNMGAGKYKRIDKVLIKSQICVVAVGLILGGSAILFGRELLSIYSKTPSVIDAGMTRMKIICTTYALCGMMDVMVGVLRGIGYSIMPMIVSLIGACGLRMVWIATIFQVEAFHTIKVVYWSYPISWLITFLVHLACFFVVRKKVYRRLELASMEAASEKEDTDELVIEQEKINVNNTQN